MALDDAPLTLARVWHDMTPDQREAAARAFWLDDESVAQQIEAVTFLARQLHFRPQSVLNLPAERKTRQLAMVQRPPDAVIGRALVVYHLAAQRPMLVMFLDRIGIAHDNGLISDTVEGPPASDKIKDAVAAISAAYPAQDVKLYLATLAVQDPDTWGSLVETVRAPGALPA